MTDLPTKARAVIIGGGISGCSVAYHLGLLGWDEVVLLERRRLTCGTTWHAAGLIGQLRHNQNMTRLAKYSAELYAGLEAETGVATGLKRNGSITVALTEERREEIYRQAALARAFGVEAEAITPSEAGALYPHLNIEGVVGAVHLPGDGQADPANIALALAKGARQRGVALREGVKATAIHRDGGRATGVAWEDGAGATGAIAADTVIDCGGMWAREIGLMAGVAVPLHACEHFYVVTEPIAGLTQLPVLRAPDECAYYKEDAGKMLLGAFEPRAKPWGMDGLPENFEFDQLPEDIAHFEPILEMGINRMPMLGEAGIHTFFNGPESFTPDGNYYLGEAPNLRGFWVAAGYNSIGIVSSGGAGYALSHWIENGEPPFDLHDVDIRRVQPFQNNRRYLRERVSETLGLLYADHFPHRQYETARGVRRSPLHEHLKACGACFGETAGWERANWFARDGQTPEYRYGWGRQDWFENIVAEHAAIRTGVGMYDMSSFGKIRAEGPDAEAVLNRVCGADAGVPVGRIVYTQFLNPGGGIEADVTVTRLSETCWLIVTPAAALIRDLSWLKRHAGEARVVFTDVTAGEGCLAVMGPGSREVLAAVSPRDWSNEGHPFGRAADIEIGMGTARAHRVSYVGELGWEIYAPADQTAHVFETLRDAGRERGLALCGMHAMDSCRIEKAFRHYGHDITGEDHVLEAGLGFAVATAKPDFIGRDAVLRKRDEGLERRLVQFRLTDPEPLLYHNEPIIRDGETVGYLTSGNYGHHLGGAIGMGYVPCKGETAEGLTASAFEIDVAGTRVAAEASLKPLYDPGARRMKA